MLTEGQVVEATCRELRGRGYAIVSTASVTRHGHDIVAEKEGRNLFIEAKGAGSSKQGTARYGSQFNSGQVFDHVAKAVLKALRVVSSGTGRAGIALPDNEAHHREVDQVSSALNRSGIAVFWVQESLQVLIDSPWDV